MDYLAFLYAHLDFITRFYSSTASPLEARKTLIERGEPPFVPTSSPEDFDGLEYQNEWDDADDFLRVLGQTGLALLAKALQDYLRAFFKREGKQRAKKADQCKDKNADWFKEFAEMLEKQPGFTWNSSPVSYAELEQINLTRNNFMHEGMIGNLRPQQDRKHFKKHPVSAFADPWEVDYWERTVSENDEPWILNVTRESLLKHIDLVRQFGVYVEKCRTAF